MLDKPTVKVFAYNSSVQQDLDCQTAVCASREALCIPSLPLSCSPDNQMRHGAGTCCCTPKILNCS